MLDLDETLIHSDEYLTSFDFEVFQYKTKKRPHVDRFAKFALENFDVGIWSSGTVDYVTQVVEHIFPIDKLQFIWGRERCTLTKIYGMYSVIHEYQKPIVKLTRRRKFKRKNIIAVDDTPAKWARSYGNLITVKEFNGSKDEEDDCELLRLEQYLTRLLEVDDVRTIDKRGWRLDVPVG